MLCGAQEELAEAQTQLEKIVEPLKELPTLNIANLTGVNLSAVSEKVQAAGLQLGKSAYDTLSTFAMPEKVRPGRELREAGYRPKHPVIIIPGAALTPHASISSACFICGASRIMAKAPSHHHSRCCNDLALPLSARLTCNVLPHGSLL